MSPTTQTPLASPELSSAASSAPDFNVKNGAQKLLPLNLDPSVGASFLLVKNSKHGADGGWSPRLMQLRGEDLFFAAGERPSTRVSKYGGATYVIFRSPGPSTRSVFLICLAGSIFLMLPQNLKTTDTSGLEIRQRKSDSSMLFLLAGFASLVCSILIIFSQRKSGLAALDPIKLARTYQSLGRADEARDVLVRALETHPIRSTEIRKALANI